MVGKAPWALQTDAVKRIGIFLFNPFTPKFERYILPTFHRELNKWYYENLVEQSFSV